MLLIREPVLLFIRIVLGTPLLLLVALLAVTGFFISLFIAYLIVYGVVYAVLYICRKWLAFFKGFAEWTKQGEVMTVNILGTEYTIHKKKYSEEPAFERRSIDGYCDHYTKNIVYCDMSTYPRWEHEPPETVAEAERQTLRHEIVHGFLSESGLKFCSDIPDGGWAVHEEMVDWLANQGPKLYKAWQEAGAL